jgi:hypothetical protein
VEVLARFGMSDCKPANSPTYDCGPDSVMAEVDLPQSPEECASNLKQHPFFELIGCLWWLVSISRPDLLVGVHNASRWIARPSEKLWKWLLKMLRYLKATHHLGLVYRRPDMSESGSGDPGDPLRYFSTLGARLISGAADSSFADAPKGRTTLGHVLRIFGCVVDYSTKVSTRVLDSSTDAECTSLVLFSHANSWWRDFLKEIGLFMVNEPTLVQEDNTSAIALANHGSATRSRHFNIAFYKVKDTIEFGDMKLVRVDTAENEADFFTKALPPARFIKHRDALMGDAASQTYFETPGAVLAPAVLRETITVVSNVFLRLPGATQNYFLQSQHLHKVILSDHPIFVEVPCAGASADVGPSYTM